MSNTKEKLTTTKPAASPNKKSKGQAPHRTTAFHAKTADGDAVVGIGNLQVMMTYADGYWFAQGMQIDYAAEGETIADVQARFESGLAATVNLHLRVFGSIDQLLKPAPDDAWREFLTSACVRKRHTQVSFHDSADLKPLGLPFDALDYIELRAA